MSEFEHEPERPEWLPEKFRSVEDLAQSYAHLERKLSEQGQQLHAQAEALQGYEFALAQQVETQPVEPMHEPVSEQPQKRTPIDPALHAAVATLFANTNPNAVQAVEPAQVISARDMKLAAQGATGSGGRPAPADEGKESWERVIAAGATTYAGLMQGPR